MSANRPRKEHLVSCAMTSSHPMDDPDDFDRVKALANRLRQYAQRLGFDVMYENADDEEAS